MDLIPSSLRGQLLANGARAAEGTQIDPRPVVRLYAPDGVASWLLTQLDPQDPDRAYGLCDLGMGNPVLAHVRLSDLKGLKGGPIVRDRDFVPRQRLSLYWREARKIGIVKP